MGDEPAHISLVAIRKKLVDLRDTFDANPKNKQVQDKVTAGLEELISKMEAYTPPASAEHYAEIEEEVERLVADVKKSLEQKKLEFALTSFNQKLNILIVGYNLSGGKRRKMTKRQRRKRMTRRRR